MLKILFLGLNLFFVVSPFLASASCEGEATGEDRMPVGAEEIFAAYDMYRTPPPPLTLYSRRMAELKLNPKIVAIFSEHKEVQYALQWYTKGLIKEADALLRSMPWLNWEDCGALLQSELKRISADRELRIILASVMNGGPKAGFPIERVLVNNAVKYVDYHTVTASAGVAPIFNFTPQMVEMGRVLLEYGNITQGTNVLEVGYGGNPAILKALRSLPFKLGNFVGLDLLAVPQVSAEVLQPLRLLQGDWPRNRILTPTLHALGPYKLIYGLDTFRPSMSYGRRFEPGNHLQYLQKLASLLSEGGRIIIMNDDLGKTVFTEQEARSAGLSIVVYEQRRSLPPREAALMAPFRRQGGNIGSYLFSVFQKGKFDTRVFIPQRAEVPSGNPYQETWRRRTSP